MASKVALIHDWLPGLRGGDYLLEAIAELYPEAEIFTLLEIPGRISPALRNRVRHTSALQKIPGATDRYRHFLPVMPSLIERFDLSEYDLVISSSHCVAKGVRKRPGAIHVSYVHAPMRYIWDRYEDYFGPGRASLPVRMAAASVRPYLQRWDRRVSTPDRVDQIICNSRFIAERVRRFYGRDSEVIYPFADLGRFVLPRQPGQEYLIVGAFAPYKRVDLAIQAFNRLGLPLVIAGGGQDEERLHAMAGPTIRFVRSPTNDEIDRLYATCKAFVFPGMEDFGITPLEAMASGAPVIAYGEGGAAETVTEKTGAFFRPQTVEALMEVVQRFEKGEIAPRGEDCRARAGEFSRDRFKEQFKKAVDDVLRRKQDQAGDL